MLWITLDMAVWFPVTLPAQKMLQHLDTPKARQQCQAGLNFSKWQQELLTHFFRRLITFSLKGLKVQISAEWAFWIFSDLLAPKGSHLPKVRFSMTWKDIWKCSLDRVTSFLKLPLEKMGSNTVEGNTHLATCPVPAWAEIQRQSSALIQEGHHTSYALGWKAGICSCTPLHKSYS